MLDGRAAGLYDKVWGGSSSPSATAAASQSVSRRPRSIAALNLGFVSVTRRPPNHWRSKRVGVRVSSYSAAPP
jgi:hypothetical protein